MEKLYNNIILEDDFAGKMSDADNVANTNLNRIRFKRHIFRINAPKSLAISAYPFNFLTFFAKNLLS